jgi:hypothetical protein
MPSGSFGTYSFRGHPFELERRKRSSGSRLGRFTRRPSMTPPRGVFGRQPAQPVDDHASSADPCGHVQVAPAAFRCERRLATPDAGRERSDAERSRGGTEPPAKPASEVAPPPAGHHGAVEHVAPLEGRGQRQPQRSRPIEPRRRHSAVHSSCLWWRLRRAVRRRPPCDAARVAGRRAVPHPTAVPRDLVAEPPGCAHIGSARRMKKGWLDPRASGHPAGGCARAPLARHRSRRHVQGHAR